MTLYTFDNDSEGKSACVGSAPRTIRCWRPIRRPRCQPVIR